MSGNPIRSQAEGDLRRHGFVLTRKLLAYHLSLIVAVLAVTLSFPVVLEYLPIGGISTLAASGGLTVTQVGDGPASFEDTEIVGSLVAATNQLDRLGYARQLMIVLVGVWSLMLPVSWVHRGIHRNSMHDHSLDETTLILPGVVSAIVMVVQHSLPLAFSLAGIVAGVQFRRALQDTFDALFILVAIGVGIAAGIGALEIASVLTVFFCYGTLYVYFLGDGLESDFTYRRKELKRARESDTEDSTKVEGEDR
jgi:hypothetical protein